MVSYSINQSIFSEYDVAQLDPDLWAGFIVKQVFNRAVHQQLTAIPALLDYYGPERVESMVREEEWLTSAGIQTAQHYFPHLRKRILRRLFELIDENASWSLRASLILTYDESADNADSRHRYPLR
jgi:hypothetical protein